MGPGLKVSRTPMTRVFLGGLLLLFFFFFSYKKDISFNIKSTCETEFSLNWMEHLQVSLDYTDLILYLKYKEKMLVLFLVLWRQASLEFYRVDRVNACSWEGFHPRPWSSNPNVGLTHFISLRKADKLRYCQLCWESKKTISAEQPKKWHKPLIWRL